ncbi:cytochrome P450 CYP82D47-like protein [Tanacetum coccineum]
MCVALRQGAERGGKTETSHGSVPDTPLPTHRKVHYRCLPFSTMSLISSSSEGHTHRCLEPIATIALPSTIHPSSTHSQLLPTDHLQPIWPHRDATDLFVSAIHGGWRWWSVGDVGELSNDERKRDIAWLGYFVVRSRDMPFPKLSSEPNGRHTSSVWSMCLLLNQKPKWAILYHLQKFTRSGDGEPPKEASEVGTHIKTYCLLFGVRVDYMDRCVGQNMMQILLLSLQACSADTTTVMLTWTLYLLLNNPRALMYAQEEVDNIVGRVAASLLPMFDIVLVIELLMLLMTSVVICAIADDVTVNLHRIVSLPNLSHTILMINVNKSVDWTPAGIGL